MIKNFTKLTSVQGQIKNIQLLKKFIHKLFSTKNCVSVMNKKKRSRKGLWSPWTFANARGFRKKKKKFTAANSHGVKNLLMTWVRNFVYERETLISLEERR